MTGTQSKELNNHGQQKGHWCSLAAGATTPSLLVRAKFRQSLVVASQTLFDLQSSCFPGASTSRRYRGRRQRVTWHDDPFNIWKRNSVYLDLRRRIVIGRAVDSLLLSRHT